MYSKYKVFFRWMLSVQLALFTSLAPLPASAEPSLSPQLLQQIIVGSMLDMAFAKLGKIHSVAEFESWLSASFNKADMVTLHERLKLVKQLPKFERLNRGIAWTDQSDRFTIVFENIFTGQVRVNDHIEWTYHRGNSLKVQLEVLERALSKSKVSLIDFVLPKAEAWIIPLTMLIVGVGLTVLVQKPSEDIIGNYYYQKRKAAWCEPREVKSSFEDSVYCKDYFAWKAANKSEVELPKSGTVPEGKALDEKVTVTPKCRTASNPDIVIDAASQDKKIVTRRTIEFGDDNKPNKVIEEVINPPSKVKVTYKLNGSGGVDVVEDGHSLYLSRLKVDQSRMDNEKFKQLDALELNLLPVIAVIKSCDEKSKATLTNAASAPGSLLATSVEQLAEKTPTSPAMNMVPTSK